MKNVYVVMVVLIALAVGGLGGSVIEGNSVFWTEGYTVGFHDGKIAGLRECPVPEHSDCDLEWEEGYEDGRLSCICDLMCYDIMGKIDSQEKAEEYAEAVIECWENEGAFYTIEIFFPEQYDEYMEQCRAAGIVCQQSVCVNTSV